MAWVLPILKHIVLQFYPHYPIPILKHMSLFEEIATILLTCQEVHPFILLKNACLYTIIKKCKNTFTIFKQ